MKMACPMKFGYFPFDYQFCPFQMESFAYRSNQLDLQWDAEDPIQAGDLTFRISWRKTQSKSPKKFNTKMELGEFAFEEVRLKKECKRDYTTGTFPCLEGQILLTRSLGYYILQGRVPSKWLRGWFLGQ